MASSTDAAQVSNPFGESHPSPSHAKKFPHLEAWLGWTHETIEAPLGSSTSTDTRRPAFWDMHLQDDLILKNVMCLPSLTETLAVLVDDAFSKLQNDDTLAQLDSFLGEYNLQDTVCTARDEAQVVSLYEVTVAKACAKIVSVLEFEAPDLLAWTVSHRHGTEDKDKTTAMSKAIADGFLRLNLDSPKFQGVMSSLPADKRKKLEAIKKHFANVMIWEFKSLFAGNLSTMEAIGALSRTGKPFPWKKCAEGHRCANALHLELDGRPKVTRARTGPDSTDTPWTLPSLIDDVGSNNGDDASSAVEKPEVRTRKRKNETSKSESPEVKAISIVQQAWAEAVVSDATILSIQSGNFEFIGVRHRASQTLYLTELMDIPNFELSSGPDSKRRNDIPYTKLQVGLFIAALRDAANRALQITTYEDRNESFPFTGVDTHTPAAVSPEAYAEPTKWLRCLPELAMSVRCWDADTLRKRDKYTRYMPVPSGECDSQLVSSPASGDPYTTVNITFGKQRAENIFEAQITLYGHPLMPVIVKFVLDSKSGKRLENEYLTCLTLAQRGIKGIVSTLGLYHGENSGMRVLVMEDGGRPLDGTERNKARIGAAFERTLTEIHRAGYLHRNISVANLLITSNSFTCVTGFSECRLLCLAEGQRAEEITREMDLMKEVLYGRHYDDRGSSIQKRRRRTHVSALCKH